MCVQRIQTILTRSRDAGLTVDGSYGPRTEAAVRRYQSARGLQADGVAGPATLLKLEFESGSGCDRVLCYALKAQRGHAMGNSTLGRWNGGSIAYGSDTGGGHGARPGPSGVDSPWSPDPNDGFIDCSGFTRWSFSLGFGYSGEQNPHARWTTGDIAAEAPRTSAAARCAQPRQRSAHRPAGRSGRTLLRLQQDSAHAIWDGLMSLDSLLKIGAGASPSP